VPKEAELSGTSPRPVLAFGKGERGPRLGPRAKGGLALMQVKNGKLVKLLPPDVIL